MQKKAVILLFVIFFLLFLQGSILLPAEDIKQKVQNYAEYDELVSNLTEVNFSGKKYWVADFSRMMRHSGSLILNDEGFPVKDENVTFVIVAARIIKENYRSKMVKSWEEFSIFYHQLSENFNLMKNSLKDFENSKSLIYLNILINDANEISDLSQKLSISLNKSIYFFSPDDAGRYLKYENILIEKLEEMGSHYDNAINSLENRSSVKELEQLLRENRASLKNTLEIMNSNRGNLNNVANLMVKEMVLRAVTKEKESTTIAWVGLGIFSFILLLVILFLIKK
ncbi:MAG: hypothetical protein QW802_03485 [Candidatus Altiarchaeota archaeon]